MWRLQAVHERGINSAHFGLEQICLKGTFNLQSVIVYSAVTSSHVTLANIYPVCGLCNTLEGASLSLNKHFSVKHLTIL